MHILLTGEELLNFYALISKVEIFEWIWGGNMDKNNDLMAFNQECSSREFGRGLGPWDLK